MTETSNSVDIAELLCNILKARSVAMTIAYEGHHLELYRYAADGNDTEILSFFKMLQDKNGDSLFLFRIGVDTASIASERNDERIAQYNEQISVLQIEALMIEEQIKLLENNEVIIEKIDGGSLFTHMKTTTIMYALTKASSVEEVVDEVLSRDL